MDKKKRGKYKKRGKSEKFGVATFRIIRTFTIHYGLSKHSVKYVFQSLWNFPNFAGKKEYVE